MEYLKYLSDYSLKLATELDEKDLYIKYKYNSRSGMNKTSLQSNFQREYKNTNNKLSVIYCLSDCLNCNIYILNDLTKEYIILSRVKEDRDIIILKYNYANKTYTILSSDNKILDKSILNDYKQFDYKDKFTGKTKDMINEKILNNYGVIQDLKNPKCIYISNPDLKNISTYKLDELVKLAAELNVNIGDIKKTKKGIYEKIYDTIN